jgi:hypothetical protein
VLIARIDVPVAFVDPPSSALPSFPSSAFVYRPHRAKP